MTTTTTTTTLPPYLGYKLSSICIQLGRPQTLTGLFREVLARHFAEPTRIEEPDLRNLVWKPDDRTRILIESAYRWTPTRGKLRPAVIIKRGVQASTQTGVGGDIRQANPVDEQGDPHYITVWTGSHTLFCIGGSGAQAELLGTEVQRELHEFGPVIMEYTGLLRFRVLQIGEVSVLEEAQENFVVPVTVGYAYEERWALRAQALRLHNLSLSMLCAM